LLRGIMGAWRAALEDIALLREKVYSGDAEKKRI
jgi:hypothetical protein